nr:10134_t:CDS:2 [Entrophospora candida]
MTKQEISEPFFLVLGKFYFSKSSLSNSFSTTKKVKRVTSRRKNKSIRARRYYARKNLKRKIISEISKGSKQEGQKRKKLKPKIILYNKKHRKIIYLDNDQKYLKLKIVDVPSNIFASLPILLTQILSPFSSSSSPALSSFLSSTSFSHFLSFGNTLIQDNTQNAQTQEPDPEQLYLGESNHLHIDDNNTDIIETEDHEAYNNCPGFNPEWFIEGVNTEASLTNNITPSQFQCGEDQIDAYNHDYYLHIDGLPYPVTIW